MARPMNNLDGKQWLKNSISIWTDIQKGAEDQVDHPAPFPLALARRVVETLTRPGELVIDPMCGSGSTLLAAQELDRSCFGLDLSLDYIDLARERGVECTHIEQDDARNIAHYIGYQEAQLCLTSPPYWDILNQRRTVTRKDPDPYSDDPMDLGNFEDYDSFLLGLREIFGATKQVLVPGGYCVVVVMDIRKGPEFFPLHMSLTSLMEDEGYFLDDIIVWDRRADYHSFRPLGYPYRFRVNKAHEYLMIYRTREED